MLLLGGVSVYFVGQNNSLVSSSSSLQSSSTSLEGNLSALGSELSNLESQHDQLLTNNANLADRIVELNSSLQAPTRLLESFHSLSNRTVIVSSEAVTVGGRANLSTYPPTVSVVNFTAKYPGYVVVTVTANPKVGEMYVSVWSNPVICSEEKLFCAAGASPYLFPGDSVLIPVLTGPVQIELGNYNNYSVSASVTVVYYD